MWPPSIHCREGRTWGYYYYRQNRCSWDGELSHRGQDLADERNMEHVLEHRPITAEITYIARYCVRVMRGMLNVVMWATLRQGRPSNHPFMNPDEVSNTDEWQMQKTPQFSSFPPSTRNGRIECTDSTNNYSRYISEPRSLVFR